MFRGKKEKRWVLQIAMKHRFYGLIRGIGTEKELIIFMTYLIGQICIPLVLGQPRDEGKLEETGGKNCTYEGLRVVI